MLDGASQQNDSNDGSNRSSLSLLHQKIRRHMKEAASVKSDASNAPQLSCCLFLENQRDVNKEVIYPLCCSHYCLLISLLTTIDAVIGQDQSYRVPGTLWAGQWRVL